MKMPGFLRIPLLLLYCMTLAASAIAQEKPNWIGEAGNAFAIDLYARLAAEAPGNLFFSPSSIETALAMTYAGARGATAAQMAAVLHLPPSSAAMQKEMGDFLNALNNPRPNEARAYELAIANALWGQKGYPFLPQFTTLLKSTYAAGFQQVDFQTDTEAAMHTINTWVEKKTHDKIKDLITPGILTPATRLVLTNAIYFKGTWIDPFDAKNTTEAPFQLSGGAGKKIPMMKSSGWHPYMEDSDFQALELGYKGNELAMIILLPRKSDGLPQLEKELTPAKLTEWLRNLHGETVDVSIPKFTMTQQFGLAPTLQAMGMSAAFSPADADFSGMNGNRNLSISAVVHKAFIDVNEQGTEAAAATGVVMTRSAIPQKTYQFRADHPFLFLIRDQTSGAILFIGRLTIPD